MMTSANDKDPRVAQAYRDLATERTPAALDDKVLAMAAATARSRYGRARGWLRPVAWAATIGLSLAFVLEMARVTDEPAPPAGVASDSVANEVAGEGRSKLREAEERAPMRSGEKREPAAPARAAAFAAQRLPPRACDDTQRASAEAWYACAASLRDNGLIDAADLELDALREAFPDFVVPESE